MPEFKATEAQRAAIETRGRAVLVSAGAGSGKTRVLTERLMRRICDPETPVDLDRFVIITYTRAAAGELRSRITQELAAALARDPGNRRLRRQSALVRRTQIGTIHSFCAAFLREFSHMAGIAPDFAVLDEQRAAGMMARALERTLESCYEQPEKHPGFLLLADTVGAGRDDRKLAELVLEVHGKMQSHARPERWAERQRLALRADPADAEETVWGREILQNAGETAAYWAAEFERMLELIRAEPPVAKAWLEGYAETAEALRELCRCLKLGWERSRACFPIPFRIKTLRGYENKDFSDGLKERRAACKKAMEKLETVFALPSEELLRDLRSSAPAMEALLDLVENFDRNFTAAKRRANLLDYADLEHLCAGLLLREDGSPSDLALQVRQRWEEILVDEYQDVNRVQDDIFRALSREGENLFLVGDVKQSVYRFRLADPGIFTEKYDAFVPWEKARPGEPCRILLRENFRSRREILDAANAVFSRCMSRSLGEVDYNEEAALRFGAKDYAGAVPVPELMLLRLDAGSEDEDAPDKAAQEAAMVARKIRELMEQGLSVRAGEGTRPLEYGDIAILLRSANNVGPIYRRELLRQGIPVGFGQGDGFFRAAEVSAVLSMLAVLDNPHQDIPLIAVLRSPALGFDADSLSAIRASAPEADFYTALTVWAKEHARGRDFLALLERLRRLSPDLRAAQLVDLLLEELDLPAVCSAMRDGEQRRARLMELVELSERFEKTGYRGLHRFVLWLRRMAEKGQEPALGEENLSAVHILSIHKSKGLEFPVVFLADLARQFNKRDLYSSVLVHPELGLGPKITDLQRRVEYPGLARSAVALRLERETLSEELRVLYVGMTRARERLFLSAGCKDPEKLRARAREMADTPMAPALLSKVQSPVSWVLAAALADGEEHLQVNGYESGESESAETPPVHAAPDPAAGEQLRRNLSFVYPHREAESLPSKLTATGLKGRYAPDEEGLPLEKAQKKSFRLPDFGQEQKPLSGTERGTATHLVLQNMDFSQSGSREAVEQEIRRLEQAGILSQREARAVDSGAILRLFASPLGERMRRAEKLRREFKFSLLCDAEDFFPVRAGEQVLLQGVVDCFIEEENSITVIDYKTDRVRNRAEAEARSKHYIGQLRAYARALERICQKPVRECLLVFLAAGETVPVPEALE